MNTPLIRGEWSVNWPVVTAPDMPHSLNELINAKSPTFLGSSIQVDDFSARHNSDGTVCRQGVLDFVPFGSPNDVVSSRLLDGDVAVYMSKKATPFETGLDGAIAAVKQRGWHAEICYKRDRQIRNAAVWGDGFKDRPIGDLDHSFFLNIYRITGPDGAIAQSPAFCQSLKKWIRIYDSYNIPPGGFQWYLDPADFSSKESLKRIAIALLNRPAGQNPGLPAVTCVQWVYTVFCLALLFPLCEETLRELGILDAYVTHWQQGIGNPIEACAPFLPEPPFAPYSPAEILQSFLNTYCGGIDLFFWMETGGAAAQNRIAELLQSACPEQYRASVQTYLRRLRETGNPKLQLEEAPHGFLMPSCFFCEERNQNRAGRSWFEYVGTAMSSTLLKNQV